MALGPDTDAEPPPLTAQVLVTESIVEAGLVGSAGDQTPGTGPTTAGTGQPPQVPLAPLLPLVAHAPKGGTIVVSRTPEGGIITNTMTGTSLTATMATAEDPDKLAAATLLHPHRFHVPLLSLPAKIRRGEYVHFDKLLLSRPQPPLYQPVQRTKQWRKEPKRTVSDLTSWLEAWNRFVCCHLSYFPATALEMTKYQAIMVMLFTNHPPAHCVEYDRLFRRAAAQNTSVRWDVIKEDIYVWAVTKRSTSFRERPPIMSRLGPAVSGSDKKETHTIDGKEICQRYNLGRCTLGDDCRYAHSCWQPGCHESHPGKRCTK